MLELHERLGRVGLAEDDRFAMPLTQEALADVLGFSVVHVNRTIQQLRRDDLLDVRNGMVLMQRERLRSWQIGRHGPGLPPCLAVVLRRRRRSW
jgi:biotin operon repressor